MKKKYDIGSKKGSSLINVFRPNFSQYLSPTFSRKEQEQIEEIETINYWKAKDLGIPDILLTSSNTNFKQLHDIDWDHIKLIIHPNSGYDNIPLEFNGKLNDWIFGCDICQEVCPWNRFSRSYNEPLFHPDDRLKTLNKKDWIQMTELTFEDLFKKSAVKRTKFKGLKRNINFNIK